VNIDMQRRALAARDTRCALLHLRKVLQEAADTIYAAEMQAVQFAIRPKPSGDISATVKSVLDRLESADFEASLKRARQYLEIART
jgi:hypothetical protein